MNNDRAEISGSTFAVLSDKFNPHAPLTISEVPSLDTGFYNEMLSTLCSESKYDDDKWIVDLLFSDRYISRGHRTIIFTNCDQTYVQDYKQYALRQLLCRKTVHSVIGGIIAVNQFASFLDGKPIIETNEADIQDYYSYLFGSNHADMTLKTRKKKWIETKYFMSVMEYDSIRIMMEKYNIQKNGKYAKADRYIPEDIAIQLDIIMKRNPYIPIAYQFIYWTLRLLVNRISEVLNCKDDCLKRFSSDTYTISIPTYKQEGPYLSTVRMIYIKDDGIGSMYIDIVKRAIDNAKQYDGRELNLLCYKPYLKSEWDPEEKELKYETRCSEHWNVVGLQEFNTFLKKLCVCYQIKDEDGKTYSPSSHFFRHNSISDRLNSGIFRDVDVQAMSFHANTQMINRAYYHADAEKQNENDTVYFKGRIINCSDRRIQKLLEKPYAMKIRDLGICSDSRGCNKEKSKCLFCDHMTPDYDNLGIYVEQRDAWLKKKELAVSTSNADYELLCDQWINGYNAVITKIMSFIEKEESI